MLRQRARAAGAVYVDTYTPSLGHDACSGPARRWIEPLPRWPQLQTAWASFREDGDASCGCSADDVLAEQLGGWQEAPLR
jgi:hypothetical protein